MEATQKDELFDDALCGMVKFTDTTKTVQKHAESEKKTASNLHTKEKKMAQRIASEPVDAEYEPVKTWYDKKAVNMVKWAAVFIGMEYIVFYWMQTGQMQESAAMPSMLVCALLAGISVGKNWKCRK